MLRVDWDGTVYIIAWSYGGRDVLNFEKVINCFADNYNFEKVKEDGDTSDWNETIWYLFNQLIAFARAAYTRKQELIEAGIPESEIIVQRIDNRNDLAEAWAEWATIEEIDGLDFYSHGTPRGPEVYHGSGDFWESAEKLNWSDSAYAKFYGCNTANGTYAQNFATIQNVVTYAQTGNASFSYSDGLYMRIKSYESKLGVYLRVFNKFLVIKTTSIPMKVFYPRKTSNGGSGKF